MTSTNRRITRYLMCLEQDQATYSKKQHLTYYRTLIETELAEIMKPPVIIPLDLIRMLT